MRERNIRMIILYNNAVINMTSVNFFDINNQKRKADDQYNILSGQTSKVNEAVNLNKYTKEMADLDNELRNE